MRARGFMDLVLASFVVSCLSLVSVIAMEVTILVTVRRTRNDIRQETTEGRARMLATLSDMLKGFAQQTAGQLISNLGKGARAEKEALEAAAASKLLNVMTTFNVPRPVAEQVIGAVAQSVVGRKIALSAFRAADAAPDEAIALLSPYITDASGGIRVRSGQDAGELP